MEDIGDTSVTAVKRRVDRALDGRPLKWLAERTGDDYKNVQRWVRGANAPPNDFIARVAVALATTTDWLLMERGPMRPAPPATAQVQLDAIRQIIESSAAVAGSTPNQEDAEREGRLDRLALEADLLSRGTMEGAEPGPARKKGRARG